ncbi:Short domain protein [Marine Group I thaumarchaeote SCGC AAA799-B03]|uniref:Short domain protein n=3 Tax=Marine Group I TaxID=905826 RepID=A0A087S7S9_9ARCH|nr:Short domain protein [Marine Group I thaumarchaeote SCGC AAA799-D11]KFM17951.1 Short domain protein [Marine Group I thaumarchaeote SCGC RSA3]KFM21783.1 Short domain protein [Marine Group I thaumarchaeote SCGC AAA799-B03]
MEKAIKTAFVLGIFSIILISIPNDVFAEGRLADFVDPNKDKQYYLDRYYNEPTYKSWFDRNYPNFTIEQAVGITSEDSMIDSILNKEIIQEADASLVNQETPQKNNSEVAQMILAIGGLGILFGAVYGVKRKVNDNTRQISINKETIKNKIIKPITRTNPLEILQIRLAKGEITIEEFESLEKKLKP